MIDVRTRHQSSTGTVVRRPLVMLAALLVVLAGCGGIDQQAPALDGLTLSFHLQAEDDQVSSIAFDGDAATIEAACNHLIGGWTVQDSVLRVSDMQTTDEDCGSEDNLREVALARLLMEAEVKQEGDGRFVLIRDDVDIVALPQPDDVPRPEPVDCATTQFEFAGHCLDRDDYPEAAP